MMGTELFANASLAIWGKSRRPSLEVPEFVAKERPDI